MAGGGGGSCPAKFRPVGSPAVRGKERGSTREPRATCGWSRRGSRRSGESCPRRTGPAAGGARRRGSSGVRGRERTGGEGAVGHEEATGGVNLKRKGAEGEVLRWPELTAAMEERRGTDTRAGEVGGVNL
jgi:hypothetical protein